MNIPIKMNKDFERALSTIDAKYGEDFEILNGFNESQLNFSDFIDGFVDKNVADVTIDGNANAHHKDICSMLGEKGKSEDKLFAFNKIFYELKKKFGLRTANCTGVCDQDYLGEYIVALHNDTDYLQVINPEDRIAQLIFLPYINIEFCEVLEFENTERGEGGFESTGK